MDSKEFLEQAQGDLPHVLTQLMLEQSMLTGAIVRALMPRQRDQALAVIHHLEQEAEVMSPSPGVAKMTLQVLATSLRTAIDRS